MIKATYGKIGLVINSTAGELGAILFDDLTQRLACVMPAAGGGSEELNALFRNRQAVLLRSEGIVFEEADTMQVFQGP